MATIPPATTKPLLTPKELAEAIGVSESSLRRWVDAGDIRVARTAGGHRRILLPEAIRFIRALGIPVIRPELLGLGTPAASAPPPGASDDEILFEGLRSGDRDAVKALIASWYLRGETLATIFDGPVRVALGRVGELWRHDGRGILVEHRATDICADAVNQLRGLLPPARDDAPLAVGGAPEGDPYQLPTLIAGAVIADAGYQALNFGPNTPVELLAKEAIDRAAKLMWLSISAPPQSTALRTSLGKLSKSLARHNIHLVLGGRHHLESTPRGRANATPVASMAQLATFARQLIQDEHSAALS